MPAAFGLQATRKMPGKVETMSLEIADHTLFVSWARMPQQQHGAQQPQTQRPDETALALLMKRQRLAMRQSKVRLR